MVRHVVLRVVEREPHQPGQRRARAAHWLEVRAQEGARVARWSGEAFGLRWIDAERFVSWNSAELRLHRLGQEGFARVQLRGGFGFGHSVRFSADGSFLVAAVGGSQEVVRWDLRRGASERTALPFALGHGAIMAGSAERPLLLGLKRACWARFPAASSLSPSPSPRPRSSPTRSPRAGAGSRSSSTRRSACSSGAPDPRPGPSS